ncbi:60S ribosomal protein l28 [Plakobranchus ocellatus]|uniref:Large ribosomal subunit protein eL28 n=1 Tax=Plakobranchus ocellatus TaxID=259542 RepID=A0AAV3Y8S0_9GAST|nr:60S ribosomal protein l28 [Plakobranchus ocellatus]
MATADLTWLIIRNNSSFLLKRSKQNMSLEANNIKSKNSFRYNGFIHRKTVGVEPAKDGKGVVLITRKSKVGGANNNTGREQTKIVSPISHNASHVCRVKASLPCALAVRQLSNCDSHDAHSCTGQH